MQAASDVNSPVSGEVSEVNSSLTDESSKVQCCLGKSFLRCVTLVARHFLLCLHQVNKEPYSGGWLMKVKLSDKGELKDLMDSTKYEDHCAKSEH